MENKYQELKAYHLLEKISPKMANMIESLIKNFIPMGLEGIGLENWAGFINFVTNEIRDGDNEKDISEIIKEYNEANSDDHIEDSLINEIIASLIIYLESMENRYISINLSVDKIYLSIKGVK